MASSATDTSVSCRRHRPLGEADRAIEAVRAISQAGLWPSNCRLLSPLEAALTGVGKGHTAELLLAFESDDHTVDHSLERALKICAAFDGHWNISDDREQEQTAEGRWRRWFLQAPYMRDRLILQGLTVETFETAISWDRLASLQKTVLAAVESAINENGGRGIVTWRLNYIYPDGAAPYYTVVSPAAPGDEIERWMSVKDAASKAIVDSGGTITHHHGVGKDHRPWLLHERGHIWQAVLAGIKNALDPAWILNPDVLVSQAARRSSE